MTSGWCSHVQVQGGQWLAGTPGAGAVTQQHGDKIARLVLRSIQPHTRELHGRFMQGEKAQATPALFFCR